jgi:hypothetical protein
MKTTKHFLVAAAFAALALFACSGDSDGDNFTDGSSSSVGDSSSSIEGDSSSSVENSSSSALADGIYLNNVPTTWEDAFASIRAGGSGTETTPKTYTISVYGTHPVPGIVTLTSSTGFGENNQYVSVTLNGNGKLYLTSRGNIILIGARQTLIIDGANLVLEGLKEGQNGATQDNDDSIIYGRSNSTLELKNGTITNNGSRGVDLSGTFKMSGGRITNNDNGGVRLGYSYGPNTFTMSGGEISGNVVSWQYFIGGGGVLIYNTTFTMTGGKISDNETYLYNESGVYGNGGGVHITNGSTFTMSGGEISGNKASLGGGVFLDSGTTFVKQGGGIIYGNDASSDKQNFANRSSSSSGHAIGRTPYRNKTLGVNDNIDSRENAGWFE